jgi:hypothetical protein
MRGCVLAALLLLSSISAVSAQHPTLLETWVYADFIDFLDINELKESQPGVLLLPHKPSIGIPGSDSMYTIKDAENCILREEKVPKDPLFWHEYYLNHVLPEHRIGRGNDNLYFLKLLGEKAVYCQPIGADPSPHCWSEYTLRSEDDGRISRIERALKYIYSNFCTYAKAEKPF